MLLAARASLHPWQGPLGTGVRPLGTGFRISGACKRVEKQWSRISDRPPTTSVKYPGYPKSGTAMALWPITAMSFNRGAAFPRKRASPSCRAIAEGAMPPWCSRAYTGYPKSRPEERAGAVRASVWPVTDAENLSEWTE